jgi:hypothetical protein
MGDFIEMGIIVLVFVALIVAWFTHIFFCFAEAAWGFLVAGALFFPIGIIHGAWLWFQ